MFTNRNGDIIVASCKKEAIGKVYNEISFPDNKIFEGRLPITDILSFRASETILEINKHSYHYSWLNILNPDYGTIKNVPKDKRDEYCSFVEKMTLFIGKRLMFIKKNEPNRTIYQMIGDGSWLFAEQWINFSIISIKILGEDIHIL
jgi:hypothetical protein